MTRVLFALPVLVALVAGAGCGANGSREAHPDALTGKVTFNGQPVKSVTITAIGPDGKPYGGTTNEEGVYTIPSPTKGRLEFQLIAPGGKAAFPEKYTKPKNGLSFEYAGGKQTYDMELKP